MKKFFLTLPLVFVFLLSFANYSFAQEGIVSATVRPNPLEVKLTFPSSVLVGEWFEVEAEVSNQGDITVSRVFATVNLPSGMSVRGLKKRLGDLAPSEKKVIKWMVKANKPGNYVVQVEVKGKLLGEEISSSVSTSNIFATGSLGAFLLRLIFGV